MLRTAAFRKLTTNVDRGQMTMEDYKEHGQEKELRPPSEDAIAEFNRKWEEQKRQAKLAKKQAKKSPKEEEGEMLAIANVPFHRATTPAVQVVLDLSVIIANI